MFQWYAEASVCYAFLVDIEPNSQPDWASDPKRKLPFERSKWWTRGWCLQELIAPRNVEFLASDWSDLGTKFSLRQLITDITGIRLQVLMGASLALCCAAEKMSWASIRETTRPEDVAYCLLGLFGVNMPLLYGEGSTKAFLRLQKEILAQEPDYSLLAWSGPCTQWRVSVDPTPALAVRPQQFQREMELAIVKLKSSREGHHVVTTCMQKPPVFLVRWEDLIFNPHMETHASRSKWLKKAMYNMKKSPDVRHSFHLVKDPTNVTNRGLHARLFVSRSVLDNTHNDATLLPLLVWTYIIHRNGLVCVWFGGPLGEPFADAIFARDEAASPVLVPFRYLKSAFTLDWIYLRLPSPNRQQDQDLRTYQTLWRDVLLIDETAPRPSLFVVARYPNPTLYSDSSAIRTQGQANLEDMRLMGCCLVDFEPGANIVPSSIVFIVMIGVHSTTNQILLKTVPWDDWSRDTTKTYSDDIAEEIFKRWKVGVSTLVEGFNNQASFSPPNGEGVVKLRVPARPRSDTIKISMSYIRTANAQVSKEIQLQRSSQVIQIVENDTSARVVELE